MAQTEEQDQTQEENGHNGFDTRKTVVRAAAIAAASGATALAAKKAFSDREPSGESKREGSSGRSGSGGGSQDDSVVSAMASSAWRSAQGTLMPLIEDAAGQAGEFVAQNGPDVVRDTIIPRFIEGFERGRKSASDD